MLLNCLLRKRIPFQNSIIIIVHLLGKFIKIAQIITYMMKSREFLHYSSDFGTERHEINKRAPAETNVTSCFELTVERRSSLPRKNTKATRAKKVVL